MKVKLRLMLCFYLLAGSIAISAQTLPVKKAKVATTNTLTAKKPVHKKLFVPENEKMVEITTDYGIMIARLYNQTPLHRDNFLKLVKNGVYDSLLFHRVIKNFMIQGGDPESKNTSESAVIGGGALPGDRIPAEFRNQLIHKKGALAAARDGNPAKASSNCQFYIVEGKKVDSAELMSVYNSAVHPNNPAFQYSKSQMEIYNRIGGSPFLDQNYTVFGEVISGLDVIDKIASAETKPGDRPVKNIIMKIRLLN